MLEIAEAKGKDAEQYLISLYKMVRERENFLSNEAKVVQYGAVLRYFTRFLQQRNDFSPVVRTVLYRIDIKLGDIYYEEALQNQDNGRYFLATAYYNQALSYAHQKDEQNYALCRLREVYYYLDDQEALMKVEEAWAENHDKKDRFSAYMFLAQNAELPLIKTKFLAKALDEVMAQDESFYTKYQDTLNICSQLVALYELLGEKEKANQVMKLRESTSKLLN